MEFSFSFYYIIFNSLIILYVYQCNLSNQFHLRSGVSEIYDGLPVSLRFSDVKASSLDDHAGKSLFPAKFIETGGELKFPTLTDIMGNILFKIFKYFRWQDVLAEHGQEKIILHPFDMKMFPGVFDFRFFIKFRY